MSDVERKFHEEWLGLVQPAEGLVVSVPVLVDAQCAEKQPREVHAAFVASLWHDGGTLRVSDLAQLFERVLELPPDRFDEEAGLPPAMSLFVPEGNQLLRPTRALRASNDSSSPHLLLVWEVPAGITNLDKPEKLTGDWDYPAQAKFERLLRECRVPIGLLSNGSELRLVYAPHGESSGWIAFRVADMASVSGRPILDAFVMLIGRARWFAVAPERQVSALLAESRRRNADVTNELARQVFEALEALLAGFAAADERDGGGRLRAALEREDEHLYAGLLTVLLRCVFLLYCEDRALLPVENPVFSANYSLLGLHADLVADHGRFPDTMHRRFGAYGRLIGLFRAVYLGVRHRDLEIPPRRGQLFDCHVYPFLEGWGPDGSAPITEPEARAATDVPSVDDLTVFTVLDKLLQLGGQRLSYKALDVEQIGSVYEALMGFDVERLTSSAVRIRLGSKKGAAWVWVVAKDLLAVPKASRASHLQDELGFDKATAKKVADAVALARTDAEALEALEPLSGKRAERAEAGTLVLQPGPERRRTSSHYTPRELTEPIVARTLEPLLRAMGESPSSETLLNLVICDPAMGSGAFLVAACRFLADQVVAAWTREGQMHLIADAHDDVVNHARRLVAQRCLYGVDKNRYAVQLARMSLWLVTMARREPFTFVDHALRHGDSLVGLSFGQVRAFHWRPEAQVEASSMILKGALDEAVAIRQQILALAGDGTDVAQQEKQRLLVDAEDALERARLVADLVVGAFFAHAKDKDRERERKNRLDLVARWLDADEAGDWEEAAKLLGQLRDMQDELRKTQVPFHWMVEFPEVFFDDRPDPLNENRPGRAYVEAFVGNPPFAAKNGIVASGGRDYVPWLLQAFDNAHGNADLCAYFFRRAAALLGPHGTIGFVATNTISEGDTRTTGLGELVAQGARIFAADRDIVWGGDAAVTVSVVALAAGRAADTAVCRLDGEVVATIDSRLEPNPERPAAHQLLAMAPFFYMGSKVYGAGFFMSHEAAERIVQQHPQSREVIFPVVGGEDINSDARLGAPQTVISFGQMPLSRAADYPSVLAIVQTLVKPERDKANEATADGAHRKKYWWQHAQARPDLYRSLGSVSRCLVTSCVTKHLLFSFQPTDRRFVHSLYVFPLDRYSSFAVLQSRVHELWARLLSSSMKTDLRYAASDCFETFPFPQPDPRTVLPAAEAAGEALYVARTTFMVETDQGLTRTYNALKDPDADDPRVLHLRALHETMDRAVIDAYGWTDLAVPSYCGRSPEDKAQQKAFEDAVIDRLFALNAVRAEEERKAGLGEAPKRKGAAKAAETQAGSAAPAAFLKSKAAKKKDPGRKLPGIK